MKSLGEELRDHRIAADLTRMDVFKRLRITIGFLEALESGAWEKLPPLTYTVGFVKTYCEYLRVSPDPYVEALVARKRSARPFLGFATSGNSQDRPAWLNDVIMWAAIVAVVALGWVAYTVVARPGLTPTSSSVQAETIDHREARSRQDRL